MLQIACQQGLIMRGGGGASRQNYAATPSKQMMSVTLNADGVVQLCCRCDAFYSGTTAGSAGGCVANC